MTEMHSGHQNNANDKLTMLARESEMLKSRLDEERQKLNDVSCERII